MKKLLSLVIVCSLIIVSIIPAFAAEVNYSATNDSMDNFILLSQSDNYSLYTNKNAVCDAIITQRLNKYTVISTATTPDMAGEFFIYYNNKMYTLPDAYEKGYFNEDDLLSRLPDNNYRLTGDINNDRVLDVKDATKLQKILGHKEANFDNNIGKIIADFNNDGNISIIDATLIQKTVAKSKFI